jgi:PKD repeat protein
VSATHAYTKAGNYTLKVTARDPDGATAAARANVTVRNLSPVISAQGDASVMKDSSAQFNGTMGDTPSDAPGLQCRWDFGDGLSTDWGFETGATHTYTRSGNFTVSFIVVDDDQAQSTAVVEVTVQNEAPRAEITLPGQNSTVFKDGEVAFSGSGWDTATDNSTLQYSWDFGDGNITEWSFGPGYSHSFTRSGNFTVRLRVRDGEGASGESSLAVTVVNRGPKVRLLSPTIREVDEDKPARFQAAGEDTESDQPLLDYTWVIGNETYRGDTVQVAFSTSGIKEYRVIVRDPDGASAEANGTIEVFNPAPTLAAELSPLLIMENGSVTYSASGVDSSSDRPVLRYLWKFGDGTESNASSGTHVFARAGTYNVKVTVSDDEGGSDERTFSVTVQPRPAPPRPTGDGETGTEIPLAPVLAAVVLVAVAAVVAVLVLRKRK